jgi:predicted acetyltransferase
MQLYLYDFTELGGPSIGEDGRFTYFYLDTYWRQEGRHPFLIRVDGALAGFALVTDRRLFEPGEDGHELAEFFVMRAYRRHGVGRAAARQVFERFPGRWWVGELASNRPAIAFWRRVIGEVTQGRYDEERWDRHGWLGVVQSFVIETPLDSPGA